jgi:protein-tyrosine-phosphatase
MPNVFNVLFLCTGNSARSILAEAIMNHLGTGRFRAFSAGSHPKGTVHPLSLELLQSTDIPVGGLHSKSWTTFSGPDAPKWISSSRCATKLRARCARYGRDTR